MVNKKMSASERETAASALTDLRKQALDDLSEVHPDWSDEVDARARKLAIGKLGIDADLAELESLEQQISDLTEQKDQLERKLKKRMPVSSRYGRGCPVHMDVCEGISHVAETLRTRALREHPAGKLVNKIERLYTARSTALAKCESIEDIKNYRVLEPFPEITNPSK